MFSLNQYNPLVGNSQYGDASLEFSKLRGAEFN